MNTFKDDRSLEIDNLINEPPDYANYFFCRRCCEYLIPEVVYEDGQKVGVCPICGSLMEAPE